MINQLLNDHGINKDEIYGNKIPHVGFNVVNFSERRGLFKDFTNFKLC